MRHQVTFEVFDAESDDPVEVTAEVRREIEEYVETFKVPPIGQHLVRHWVVEFTRRGNGCTG